MIKADEAKAWALAHVGCPYIYGATGGVCTPAYREARASQYPAYTAKIRKNCPRLSGSAGACTLCRWQDPDTGVGKCAYDCAQLVRRCMEHVGVAMVSGANSQWANTAWEQAGEIGTMPRGKVCLVYRFDEEKKRMGHTGIYLGDGTVVHAKGHDWGVVQEKLGDPKFTHWGIPWGLYEEMTPMAPTYQNMAKGASGAYVYIIQAALCISGKTVTIDGKFGAKTEAALREYQAACGINVTGACGADTWAQLLGLETQLPAEKSMDAVKLAVIRDAIETARQGINHLLEGNNNA